MEPDKMDEAICEADTADGEPVNKAPPSVEDEDKTVPMAEDFPKDYSCTTSVDPHETYAGSGGGVATDRVPADLPAKNTKQVLVGGEVCVRKPNAVSLLRTNREPAPETRKCVDFSALGMIMAAANNNNNNCIDEAIIRHLLLSNRGVTVGDSGLQGKTKKTRDRKRRRDDARRSTGGTSGTDSSTSGSGSTPDSSIISASGVVLDVLCGQNQASLSVDKLSSGSKAACVLLSGTWLTPNQYQHVSGRGTARDWKRSIKHNGTSLKALLSSKVLTLDPPMCRCSLCMAITVHSKHRSSVAVGADQENRPPGKVDSSTSGGNGRTTVGSRIQMMEALSSTGGTLEKKITIVEDDEDDDDDDDEEEEEEEDETQKEVEEEEDEEEEEDWVCKRALMQALDLKELQPSTVVGVTDTPRKRKSVQPEVAVFGQKRKKNSDDKESVLPPTGSVKIPTGSALLSAPRNDRVTVAPDGVGRSLTLNPTGVVVVNASKSAQLRATQSFQKEETLNSIIYELRNYRRNLEERIVAGRHNGSAISDSKGPASGLHPGSGSLQHRSSPGVPSRISPTSNAVHPDGRTSDGRGRTKGGPDEKGLPDIVRPNHPSTATVTTTTSHAGGVPLGPQKTHPPASHNLCPSSSSSSACHCGPPRYVVDPRNGAKYDCDEDGAVDLRVGARRPPNDRVPSPPGRCRALVPTKADLGSEDGDRERVLDLSASAKVGVRVKVEERQPKRRRRSSDGHSRPPVQKQTSLPVSAGRLITWSVSDVVKFLAEVPGCSSYSETFKRFGVTGATLFCLSVDQMTAVLRMRVGAAQALRSAIDRVFAGPSSTAGAPLVP